MELRKAQENDCKDLWAWRNHPDVRKWSFNPEGISYGEHEKWFREKMEGQGVFLYIAEDENGGKIGQARFEIDRDSAKINVNLNPAFFGRGLGSELIREATRMLLKENEDIREIQAEIMDDNMASQKAFEKAGYMFKEKISNKELKAGLFVYTR